MIRLYSTYVHSVLTFASNPASVISREKCWYGSDCRTATHNHQHARRLDHLFPASVVPTVLSQRPTGTRQDINILNPNLPPLSLSNITFRLPGHISSVLASGTLGVNQSTIPTRIDFVLEIDRFRVLGIVDIEAYHRLAILFETEEMKWVLAKDGLIPAGENPVVGGNRDGIEMHHAAAYVNGIRLAGKVSNSLGGASIWWKNKEWCE